MGRELAVELAGVPFLFTVGEGEVEPFLPASFPIFATTRSAHWRVVIEPAPVEPDDGVETAPVLTSGEGWFSLEGMGVSARADLAARRARLVIPPSPHALAVVLRHLLPLAVEDGVLFHAALLARGGRAWLCCGSSGAGKSTLARLLPEHARCDEMAAVRWLGEEWHGEALPFWQSRAGHSRLEAVYLLRHGEGHRRSRLTGANVLRQLAPHLLWPAGSPPAVGRALQLLGDLVARVPVYELEFLPRPDVLEVITRSPEEVAA